MHTFHLWVPNQLQLLPHWICLSSLLWHFLPLGVNSHAGLCFSVTHSFHMSLSFLPPLAMFGCMCHLNICLECVTLIQTEYLTLLGLCCSFQMEAIHTDSLDPQDFTLKETASFMMSWLSF